MHRDQVPIPEPCGEDWDAMDGDERRRFCRSCAKHVHDLSAVSAPEAEALLADGDRCVRYRARPDGRLRHHPVLAGAALGALLVGVPAAASVTPPVDGAAVLERLEQHIADAIDAVWDRVTEAWEPAIDLDQLDETQLDPDPTTRPAPVERPEPPPPLTWDRKRRRGSAARALLGRYHAPARTMPQGSDER